MCQDDKLYTRQALKQPPRIMARIWKAAGGLNPGKKKTVIGHLRRLTILGGVLEFIGKFEAEVVKESQKLGK